MKLILDSKDVEELIKKHYNGVENVSIQYTDVLEVVLSVDMSIFSEKTTTKVDEPKRDIMKEQSVPPLVRPLTLIEKNELEAKNGLMSSGGANRTLIRF